MKFLKFIYKNRRKLLFIFGCVASISLFLVFNEIANEGRVTPSVGGEIFIMLVPFGIVALRDTIHNFIDKL